MIDLCARRYRLRLAAVLFVLGATLAPHVGARVNAEAQTGYYLAAWGVGAAGPLGTTACCDTRLHPTAVPGTGRISAIAATDGGSVAALPDGTVWAWGQYLPRPTIPALLPKQIPGLAHVVALAAGGNFLLALTADGSVWSWGSAALGRPVATVSAAATPAPIPGLSHIVQIAAGGGNAMAITAGGDLYSWGENWTGEIGDGTRTQRATPVRVSRLSTVISAATSGQNAVALEADGSVWAWGDAANGVPKRPGIIQSTVPVHVPGIPHATQVVAGWSTGLALAVDGTVWAWGENGGDALHTGKPSNGSNGSPPAPVIGLHNVTAIASGSNRYMAIESDGSVWTWVGGIGGPVRQPGLTGAAAITASPEQWLALVSTPPPTPARPKLSACTQIVHGNLAVAAYPSAMLVDQGTGHVFVVDSGRRQSGSATSLLCSASLTTVDGRTGHILRTVLLGKGTASFALSPMQVLNSRAVLAQDGKYILVAYQPSLTSQDTAGGISIVDASTGKLQSSVPVGYEVNGLAANDRTHRAFVSYTGDTGAHNEGVTVPSLAIVATTDGTMRTEPLPLTGVPVVDRTAGRLFVLGDTASVAVATGSGAIVRKVTYSGGSLAGFGLDDRTGRLFISYSIQPHCCGPSLQLLDTQSGKRIAQLGTDAEYGPVTVDVPAGRVLVPEVSLSSAAHGITAVLDAKTGRLYQRLSIVVGASAVDSRNARVYTVTGPNTVTALDPSGWHVTSQYHPGGTLQAIVLDQHTDRLFVLSSSGPGINALQTVHSICIARRCR